MRKDWPYYFIDRDASQAVKIKSSLPFSFNRLLSRGALLGRMGARESVPERFAAEALSHARGRAGARARALRFFARIVTEP